jgi:cytochrome b
MTSSLRVWDPFVRIFHWTLVAGFTANALIDAPGKQTHRWVGYTLMGLLALRVLWGLIGPTYARFRSFPPDPSASLQHLGELATGRRRFHAGHSPLGALMVYNLLITVAVIGLSGWMLTTVSYFGVKWVEMLHSSLVVWAEISVGLHISAVLFESRRLGVNLPKAMVTGYKTVPATRVAYLDVSDTHDD